MTHDLVVFGEDWGRHPSSTQHLVQRLARDRRVIWVNSIGMRRPRLTLGDAGRAMGKVMAVATARFAKRPIATSRRRPDTPAGLTILQPAAIAWPGSRAAFEVNRWLLGRQIRAAMRSRGIERPVLWTSLPTALPVVGEIGERGVLYYCGDDFGALAGVDHEPVTEMERHMVERADIVLAASSTLASRFPAAKTRLVPHGADVALFGEPAPRAPELEGTCPVAGFYGSLSDWIDVELIANTARLLDDWRFILVGPVKTDITALRDLANVELVPPQPHSSLPRFSQHWDVSLLPFRDTPQIRACNPLKLREYLAAGAPIVSTDFPALQPYRDLIEVANGAEEFAQAIRASVGDRHRDAARRERVRHESWEDRAIEVANVIAAL